MESCKATVGVSSYSMCNQSFLGPRSLKLI